MGAIRLPLAAVALPSGRTRAEGGQFAGCPQPALVLFCSLPMLGFPWCRALPLSSQAFEMLLPVSPLPRPLSGHPCLQCHSPNLAPIP